MHQAVVLRSGMVRLINQPDPGPPGFDEVLLEMRLAPINQADLLTIAGRYRAAAAPDAAAETRLGAEGVGVVVAAGMRSGLVVGDLAMPRHRGCWAQRLLLKAADTIAVPPGVTLSTAATLRINPATAARLLGQAGAAAGTWIIQSGGGTDVARRVARHAIRAGLRCCSVVRDLARAALPADGEILVDDGDGLQERIAAITGRSPPRLALDCVAGAISGVLAACLAPGGTLVVYGHLSGEACRIPSMLLTAHGIVVHGFSLRSSEAGQSAHDLAAFYAGLAGQCVVEPPHVAATCRLDRIETALAHAARPDRGGRIMLDLRAAAPLPDATYREVPPAWT